MQQPRMYPWGSLILRMSTAYPSGPGGKYWTIPGLSHSTRLMSCLETLARSIKWSGVLAHAHEHMSPGCDLLCLSFHCESARARKKA
eukprot:2873165-Pleurochrysis_carterae.AAC.2